LGAHITFLWFDNTDPGAGGWLVLAVWFVLLVLVLNTIIFTLRRLFRRRRGELDRLHSRLTGRK
jgi:hypothetical protein